MKIINYVLNLFSRDNKLKCHYCSNSFSFKEREANHSLIACSDCKNGISNDPMTMLTSINEYTL